MSDASTTSTGGYGQQQPDDVSTDLAVILFACRKLIERLDTMKLVQVKAVNPGQGTPPAAGTVDVLPLVNQIDGGGFAVQHGVVHGIPYWRLQGGKWAVVVDPTVGDIGYVVCADRDSSSVVSTQAQANPGSRRKYHVSDGIYMGGCLNAAATQYVWLKSDGTLNITDANGNVLQTSASGFVFTGNVKVNGTLQATQLQTDDDGLTVTGNISATGTITAGLGGADQVGLQTHTHPANGSPPTPGT